MKVIKVLLTASCAIAALLAVAIWKRHALVGLAADNWPGHYTPLQEHPHPVPNSRHYGSDVHFFVAQLDEKTYAIGEPEAWTKNFSYLILGNKRALLFDAGIGQFDIRPIIQQITDLPLTFSPSHFHYDHTGQADWERVAIIDMPHIRQQAEGNTLALTGGQYLGGFEGLEPPVWHVTEWIKPGEYIDLGERKLKVLYTPGHTDNSVSLVDEERDMMFSGDFIMRGHHQAFSPTSSMGDYLQSARRMTKFLSDYPSMPIYSAHGMADGSDNSEVPVMWLSDVSDLKQGLKDIYDGKLKGEGIYPVIYIISDRITLEAEPRWLQIWDETYTTEELEQLHHHEH
ncbi:MAG: hypothetical protein CSB44_06095 [Gammaproteobacteria bacterium]|nr:MAG: hypothetical protein CSB44_06095 [Gammaproteobacteria bacterium]